MPALAWLTGGNETRIDNLFRSSALMREKWDRRARTGETYGQGTIREALEKWDGSTYQPKPSNAPTATPSKPALTRDAWAATIGDEIFERAENILLSASGHHRTVIQLLRPATLRLTALKTPPTSSCAVTACSSDSAGCGNS
ncbi:MAG: hypothetical protein HC933_00520 [Pleurocapsa sp. SU_196_0]|nr:hypothetical protein [Pleurocapsa sp. SU_196_0]